MLLTLHETLLFVAPETVEVKVCELPKSTDAVAGVTVTLTEEGIGGGGVGMTELAIAPPQPAAHAAAASRARTSAAERGCTVAQESETAFSERGRMHWRNAGEVPARLAMAELEARSRNSPGKHGKLLESRDLGCALLRKWNAARKSKARGEVGPAPVLELGCRRSVSFANCARWPGSRLE